MITTIIRVDRKLSNLAKIYINNVKYSGHNNSFIFKLVIFYNFFFRADILPKAKIKAFSIILKGFVLGNHLSNIGISNTIMNFNQIHYFIRRKWIQWDKTKGKTDETKIGIG